MLAVGERGKSVEVGSQPFRFGCKYTKPFSIMLVTEWLVFNYAAFSCCLGRTFAHRAR